MEYQADIERRAGVQKKEIKPKKFLFFVPDGTKFAFCSNDPQLQKWCENVKNKKVKGFAIPLVAAAAKKYMDNNNNETSHFSRPEENKVRTEQKNSVSSNKMPQVKEVDWSQEKNILANFNRIFNVTKENWTTRQDGYDKNGRAMSKAMLRFNNKDYSARGYSNKEAMREVIITILDENYNVGIKKQRKQQEKQQEQIITKEERQRQLQKAEEAKYYKTLMECPDVVVTQPWGNEGGNKDVYSYNLQTDYGIVSTDTYIEIVEGTPSNPFESDGISMEMIKKAQPSKEEKEEFNQIIDDIRKEYIDSRKQELEAIKEKEDSQQEIKEAKEQTQKNKQIALSKHLNNSKITKEQTDKGWQYQILTTNNTKYILDISFDIVNQERRKYRQLWDDKELIEKKMWI